MARPKGTPLPEAQALAMHEACRQWHRRKKEAEKEWVRRLRNEIVSEIIEELAERKRLVMVVQELERLKGRM